jgi:hypothetical protein
MTTSCHLPEGSWLDLCCRLDIVHEFMRARTLHDINISYLERDPVYESSVRSWLRVGRGEAGGLAERGGSGPAGGAAVNATSAAGGADGRTSSAPATPAVGRASSVDPSPRCTSAAASSRDCKSAFAPGACSPLPDDCLVSQRYVVDGPWPARELSRSAEISMYR